MVSIINSMVWCGTILLVAFLILLSMPKSMLRSVLLEILGWLGAALAALYVISPIDIIPDFIPVAGWVDDLGAIVAGIASAIAALRAKTDRKELQDIKA